MPLKFSVASHLGFLSRISNHKAEPVRRALLGISATLAVVAMSWTSAFAFYGPPSHIPAGPPPNYNQVDTSYFSGVPNIPFPPPDSGGTYIYHANGKWTVANHIYSKGNSLEQFHGSVLAVLDQQPQMGVNVFMTDFELWEDTTHNRCLDQNDRWGWVQWDTNLYEIWWDVTTKEYKNNAQDVNDFLEICIVGCAIDFNIWSSGHGGPFAPNQIYLGQSMTRLSNVPGFTDTYAGVSDPYQSQAGSQPSDDPNITIFTSKALPGASYNKYGLINSSDSYDCDNDYGDRYAGSFAYQGNGVQFSTMCESESNEYPNIFHPNINYTFACQGEQVCYPIIASDPDPGDTVTLQLLSGPISYTPQSAATMLTDTICFNADTSGVYRFIWQVSDNNGAITIDTIDYPLTVNSAPVTVCPDDTLIQLCDPEEICIGPFVASDLDANLDSCMHPFGTFKGHTCFGGKNIRPDLSISAPSLESLQDYFDGLGQAINVYSDQSSAALFQTGLTGTSTFTLHLEMAGFAPQNKFGVYSCGKPDSLYEVFNGSDAVGHFAEATFNEGGVIGKLVVRRYDEDSVLLGTNTYYNVNSHSFGFYLESPDQGGIVLYSEDVRNPDSLTECIAYQGTGALSDGFWLAWEDLDRSIPGHSDDDFNDMLVFVDLVVQANGCRGYICFTPDTSGVYAIPWGGVDECGLSSTCTTYVTVELNDAPVATCPGDTTITTGTLNPICLTGFTVSDPNSNIQSISVSPGTLSGDTVCFTPVSGANQITLIVTDSCGVADTCVTNVNVLVNTPPVCPPSTLDTSFFLCAPTQISLPIEVSDPDNNLTGTVILDGPGTLDGDTLWLYTPSASGTDTVTIEATDSFGATCSFYFIVNVTLNSAPTVSCPSDVSLFVCDLSEICLPGFGSSDVDGNLTSVTVSSGALSGDTVCFTPTVGANVITFIATDACGAADTCQTTVTVTLNSAPVASCPGNSSLTLCGPEEVCIGPFEVTDADGNIASQTFSLGTLNGTDVCFTPDTAGVYTITQIVTDSCGVADTCTTQITVDYTTAPSIAGQSFNIYLCASGDTCFVLPGVTGGSAPYTFTVDGSPADSVCFTLNTSGSYNKTVIVTDSCGKADTATYTVNATVNVAPTVTCANDTSLFVCDLGQICLTGFSANDANGNLQSVVANGGTYNAGEICFTPVVGANVITFIATDSCGAADTCVTTVTVTLNSAPIATCPGNSNFTLCGPEQICVGPFSFSDADNNIDSEAFSFGSQSGDDVCFTPDTAGVYTITYVVTDECGASDTCAVQVTVNYSAKPVIADQNESIALCAAGSVCYPLPSVTGGAGPFTFTVDGSPADSVCFTLNADGVYNKTVIVTDSCGKADTATFTVNAMVNTAPVITGVDNAAQFICDAGGTVCVKVSIDDPGNGISGVSQLGTYNPADSTVCFTADTSGNYCDQLIITDSCGLADTVSYCVAVTVNSAPSVTCANDTSLFVCDLSQICLPGFSASDANGNLQSVVANGGTYNAGEICFTPVVGANVITFIATDSCGAADTCVTTVTVNLNSAPVATCPGNSSFTLCGPEQICVGPFSSSDVDNNIDSEAFSFGSQSGDDICFTPDTAGVYTISYVVTDECGAADTCVRSVTVAYTTKPVIADQNKSVALCAPGSVCYALPSVTGGSAPFTFTVDGAAADSVCFTLNSGGVFNKTVIVTDSCGKKDTAIFTVTATVNTPPVISGVDNAPQFACGAGDTICVKFSVTDPGNSITGTSQLGLVNMADSTICFVIGGAGQYCDQLIISDSCGLADTLEYCIDITTNTPPVATCPGASNKFVCSLSSPICITGFTSSDVDGNIVSRVVSPGTLSNDTVCFTPVAGANVITYIVTDACGAVDTCQTTITVTVNAPPVANCPGDANFTYCGPQQVCVNGFSSSDPDGNLQSSSVNFGTLNAGQVCFNADTAGVYRIIYTATDVCGATTACTTLVTISYYAAPQFSGNASQNFGAVCDPGTYCVALPTVSGGNPPYTYNVTGAGTLSGDSVCFNLAVGNNSLNATAVVTDACGKKDTATISVNAMVNRPPQVTCPGPTVRNVCNVGSLICVPGFNASDPDGNLDTVYAIGGNYSGGSVCFTPSSFGDYDITLVAIDECGIQTTCEVTVSVNMSSASACDTCPTITIEKAHNVLQGHQVCISVTSEGSVKDISGYDFLIAYDNSALTALGANPGDHLTGCGWEYFTYRFGANGNCSNGCPSGLIRVVGLAETNNGGGHPICFGPTTTDPIELAEICFLVSNDRNLECQFAPVRFFWMDCGDNALTDKTGDTLFISDLVYDYGNPNPINNPGVGFPTYFGAQAICLNDDDPNKPSAISCVTFQNGGIDIICADSIDARGDLNLNGVSNEIADAVMYGQYFVHGLAAFTIAPEGQIAASEVNADGIPLTVADLVYLIRVIVGDAMPIPKLDHGSKTVNISQSDNNYVTIDHELGAALFVFDGYVEVTLVQSQMNLSIGLRDGKTYALVAPEISDGPMNETIHIGEVLIASAPLISVQAAEPNGAVTTVNLRSGTLPGEFTLHQNYPNPFNPATKIAFDLPYATAYMLEVYNVAGQRVADFTGQGQGRVEVTWEANASASGMYLYKLTAGNFVSTRKMILLK